MSRYEEKSEHLAALLSRDSGQDPRVEAAELRLQECTNQGDAFEAVREIVANLFGSEEMVLFGVDPPKHLWWRLWSFGVTDEDCCIWQVLTPPVLKGLFAGEVFLGSTVPCAGLNAPVTAFVPIVLNGHTVAVLVIFRLLRQKSDVETADIDLLKVITDRAGSALFGRDRF